MAALHVLAQVRQTTDEQLAAGALISLAIAAALLGGAIWVRSRRNEIDRAKADDVADGAARELAAKRKRLTIWFWVLLVFGISFAAGALRDIASATGG